MTKKARVLFFSRTLLTQARAEENWVAARREGTSGFEVYTGDAGKRFWVGGKVLGKKIYLP